MTDDKNTKELIHNIEMFKLLSSGFSTLVELKNGEYDIHKVYSKQEIDEFDASMIVVHLACFDKLVADHLNLEKLEMTDWYTLVEFRPELQDYFINLMDKLIDEGKISGLIKHFE